MNTLGLMEPKPIKLRDLPPFSLRLHPDMRAALEREAAINGRTLSSEILTRLRTSLDVDHVSSVVPSSEGSPGAPHAAEALRTRPMPDTHRMLLALFEGMGPDKQLALLTVLKR